MRLAVIGVGLLGGSAAAAWRAAGAATQVTGIDTDPTAAARAVERGIIDRAAPSIAEAVAGAELILLAVPVGAMRSVLREVASAAPPYAIVTDVGSTKASVIAAAQAELSAGSSFSFRRFVPAHPIAGSEQSGVEHANAALFRGRLLVTTPVAQTHPEALARVEALWRGVGAEVIRMVPEEHDRIFAAVSHLPHLLAFALMAQLASEEDGDRKFGLSGAGFRDFTRIAASSPDMWRDIALANSTALSAELRSYRRQLDELQDALDAGDAARLQAMFDRASRARRQLKARGAEGA